MAKKILKDILLDKAGVDLISRQIQSWLSETKMDRRNMTRLRLALEKAKDLGLEQVLITCDDQNLASSRVMEKNGCVLRDKIENIIDEKRILTRRYVCLLQK